MSTVPGRSYYFMYSGWQVWDGQYWPIRTGGTFAASIEFGIRTEPRIIDEPSSLTFENRELNKYFVTARVVEVADVTILDVGELRLLQWSVPGGSARFTRGTHVAVEVDLYLNTLADTDTMAEAIARHSATHTWQVQGITKLWQGSDDATAIDEATMQTVAPDKEYCIVSCSMLG